MKQEELTYEEAMQRLEKLAAQMEGHEVSIDELATRLQEAQKLMQFCKERLYAAEKSCESLLDISENA